MVIALFLERAANVLSPAAFFMRVLMGSKLGQFWSNPSKQGGRSI